MKFAVLALFLAIPATVLATKASLLEETCQFNTYMCCWNENDGQGMEDNTDVCMKAPDQRRRLGSSSSMSMSESYEKFGGDNEGDIHCHGFAWADGASVPSFIIPLYDYVRMFDHEGERGYFGKVPGGPTCECIEKMPVVSRADCTTFSPQGLVSCEDNDLRTHYEGEMQSPRGDITDNLVGTCPNA